MINLEKVKKYFWYVFGLIGVVFFWAGVWDGLGNLSYLQNPLISLAVGIIMLTISGFIFKESNPFWGKEKAVMTILQKVHAHPRKHEFHIKYHDELKKKEIIYRADKLKAIEKDFLVFLEKGKEVFVPTHRVKEVLHKGKTHWKA